MSVIRKFATKVAMTPERILPSDGLVCACVLVERDKVPRLPFVPCLFYHRVSYGHVNTVSRARALAETGCHVTIGLEQDHHTHLVSTLGTVRICLAHKLQRRSQSQVTSILCIRAIPIWTPAWCSLKLSSPIPFKTCLIPDAAAQWELHRVLLHCDAPCNYLAHPIRRGSRSLATRIPCNPCKCDVNPGHG